MNRKEFRGKGEVGRELPSIQRSVQECLDEFDRNEILTLSLSVMSGLNDMNLELQRGWLGISDDLVRSTILKYLKEWWIATEFIILYAFHKLPSSPINPGQPPGIRFIVGLGPSDQLGAFMQTQIEEKEYDPDKDLIWMTKFSVANKSGQMGFIALDGVGHPMNDAILRWIDVRLLLGDASRVLDALKIGRDLWVDDKGFHHPFPTQADIGSHFSDLAKDTYISSGLQLPHKWATDLMDVGQLTIEKARIGKGSLNRSLLKKENETLRKDFHSLPEFSETFFLETRMNLDDFMTLIHEVALLGYPRPSSVFIGKPRRLVKKLSKKTDFSKKHVQRLLDILNEYGGGSLFKPILRLSDDLWLTSFDWAESYKLQALNNCFYGPYDFDLRGKVFEQRCRDRLTNEGYMVYPGRVPAVFPQDLVRAFEKKFGFKKRNSDLDILAYKKEVLLVVECKEMKPKIREWPKKRITSHLQSRRNQLEFLTRWMALSKSNLLGLIPKHVLQRIGTGNNRAILVPVFLVNLDPQLPEDGPMVVRYERLRGIGELPIRIRESSLDKMKGGKLQMSFEVWGTPCVVRAYPLQFSDEF